MKIALFDPYTPKFTGDMVEWWRRQGHEVKVDRYYDPELVEWGDVIFFDTCDNNLLSATNPGDAIQGDKFFDGKHIPWDLHEMDLSKKKIIVRPIDIECWQGQHAHETMWDVVNDCIFIAPHIRDMVLSDSRPMAAASTTMKVHTIPCGVNLDRWTFKERGPGNKVGIVAERWVSKGIDYAIQLAIMLPNYEFHWLGQNNDYAWEHEYLKDKVAKCCPNLILEEGFVDNLDAWWEDKNYALSCSHKEAYGYSIAEAMAKGVKPIIHSFYGAESIWPGLTWDSLAEAEDMITGYANYSYDSASYRQYLIDHKLDLESMMRSFDAIINS